MESMLGEVVTVPAATGLSMHVPVGGMEYNSLEAWLGSVPAVGYEYMRVQNVVAQG